MPGSCSITGQSAERLQKDTDRDFIMDAEEAKEYGIIDEVITSREVAGITAAVGAA
jgi:ATP-dependent Clp protease protease subunit